MLATILMGSTFKGIIVGVLSGVALLLIELLLGRALHRNPNQNGDHGYGDQQRPQTKAWPESHVCIVADGRGDLLPLCKADRI